MFNAQTKAQILHSWRTYADAKDAVPNLARTILGRGVYASGVHSAYVFGYASDVQVEYLNTQADNSASVREVNRVRAWNTRPKDSKRYEYQSEYDPTGKVIHYKESTGYYERGEYDKNGKMTHYNDSTGYEEWREYDDSGSLIHYKNSDGVEKWYEYDENGDLIHYKNANGYEEWY